MADKTVRGRFVWHELMTPDTAAAHTFYAKALGWQAQPSQHDPSYSMFAASSGPLGGSVAAAANDTPQWIPYIGTADVAATIAEAKALGGQVTTDVSDVPGGGKYAVLKDPQGATFAVYSSSSPPGKESPPKRGEYSWHELNTSDYAAAFEFYSKLFGWEKTGEHDMGEMGVYFMFGRNGNALGGMFNVPNASPYWLGYVRVKNVNQALKKVTAAGGKVTNGPMEVPGGDWIVQFTDPHGAMFAVHALAADMKPADASGAPAAEPPAAAAPEPAAPAPATKPAAKQPPAKQAPAKKKAAAAKTAPAKKAPAKKAPAKKAPARKPATKKAASKKKRAATKTVKRPARKVAKKAAKKTPAIKKRSGGTKKKTASKPRKGK